MTYNEANKIIEDNRKALERYTMNSNPPHLVLGSFVSTAQSDMNREQYIFEQCIEKHKDNKEVLIELNIFSEDLKPFVCIKMKGNKILMPLESYLSTPLGNDE